MSSSLGTVAEEEEEEEEKGFNNQWEMVSLGHPKQKQQANANLEEEGHDGDLI